MVHNENIFPFLWIKGEEHELIKKEIEAIKSAGIDEFVVESRTHPDFLGEQWWIDFEFILKIAKKFAMKVWLLDDKHFPTGFANGAVEKYPERKKQYIYYSEVDVYSEGFEVSIDLNKMSKPRRKWTDIKKDSTFYDAIAKNKIISIVAYPVVEDNLVDVNQYIDLSTHKLKNEIDYVFPRGVWRVVVVYITTENGGEVNYINMLDRKSVKLLIDTVYDGHYNHFNQYFGNTFRGFFSDEPGFGNAKGFAKDEIIGKKDMHLPWSSSMNNWYENSNIKHFPSFFGWNSPIKEV